MKRIIAAATLALIMTFTFAGCNTARETMDGAGDVVKGMGEDASEAAKGMQDMLTENNGAVTDHNGFIGDNDTPTDGARN